MLDFEKIFPLGISDYRETFDMAELSHRGFGQPCALPSGLISAQPYSLPDFCSKAFYSFCLLVHLVKAFKKPPSSVRKPCPFPVLCPGEPPRGQKHLSFRRTARPLLNTAVRTAVLSANHKASGEVKRWRGRRIEMLSEGRGKRCTGSLCYSNQGMLVITNHSNRVYTGPWKWNLVAFFS